MTKAQSARTILIEIADEFQNDYLTVEKYADHNGLHIEQARKLIELAQNVRASEHPDA